MVNCLFVVNKGCIHKGFLGFSSNNNPEDSNLVSVEAMQLVLLYLPLVMIGVIENISHSTAKMCHSTIMHVAHSCSNCQWDIVP
jgi:hypothetical protein